MFIKKKLCSKLPYRMSRGQIPERRSVTLKSHLILLTITYNYYFFYTRPQSLICCSFQDCLDSSFV